MQKKYFIGFSTVKKVRPPFTLTDIDLVKQDILNQFHTIKGERVMLPTFGSDIPKILMDPMDETTIDLIVQDAITVIQSEPRVSLVDIKTYVEGQVLTLDIELDFKPEQVRESLYVTFNIQTQEAY